MSADSSLKAALRMSHRQRRSGCDPLDPGFARQLTALPEWGTATTIAGYIGYGSEPRATQVLAEAAGRGLTVLISTLLADGDLAWSQWDGDLESLQRKGNLLQPREHGDVATIAEAQIIITPALAVDRRGHRLGQGGGSFDRALRRAPQALKVALVYDHDLVDELPNDPHDEQVDIIITPSRTLRV